MHLHLLVGGLRSLLDPWNAVFGGNNQLIKPVFTEDYVLNIGYNSHCCAYKFYLIAKSSPSVQFFNAHTNSGLIQVPSDDVTKVHLKRNA